MKRHTFEKEISKQGRAILPCLLVFSLLFVSAKAQTHRRAYTNDAQLWENFNVDKKLSMNWTARFSHEGRFTNNDSRLTYFFEDIGAEYKLRKTHFSFILDYVFIRKLTQKPDMPEYWDTRHQFYTAVLYSKKFGQLELHDRQMFMGQVKEVKSSADGKVPEWYLRNKVTVKYNFSFYWSVYAATELYWKLVQPQPDAKQHFDRERYFVGAYYRPNRRSEFEIYYLVEQHMHVENANHNYILGLGYGLSL